jgi:excisionase family DNA binding protein
VTVREAAALLGVSVQSVHKACRVGRIRVHHVRGIRVLERDGLERRWWGSSQRLADRPAPPPPAPATPAWDQIAALLNAYLGDSWPPPPYTGEQAATLAMCLALATDGE